MPDDRRDLVAQLKNRALIYLEIYDVLAEELGAGRAEALLARAIERRGRDSGRALAAFAPADFDGLCRAFIKGVPGEGALFAPEIRRCDAQGLEIQFHACPLKDAWEDAGLSPDKRALLCRVAGKVDKGMFEAAGFAIDNRTWTPGAAGCCFLSIRRA
ncbi:MAG: L-2-amino-thiazoline-4-carboxylic acid hydrolase [Burkholderiales bacterium]|nr:L-2-amino-thiazoline-4-carboxylic acid hydrolase [Burkholderiales bacterium]